MEEMNACFEKQNKLHRQNVCFELQMLSHMMKRYLDRLADGENIHPEKDGKSLSGANMYIIGYLYENRNREVYQKELEEKLNVRKSTISKVLRTMESKGFVRRESVERDARLKRIVLTEETIHYVKVCKENFKKLENKLTKGFTEEELEQFLYLMSKAKKNFEE